MDSPFRVKATAAPVRMQVVSALQQAIESGRFAPGERLIERELCDLTGVSRTSVREALRELESRGLVQMVPNRGPIVAVLTLDETQELYEVRAALEGLAGELFATRATDAQVEDLRARVNEIKRRARDGETVDLTQVKDGFYELLFEGAGNSVARLMLDTIHSRITLLRRTTLSRPDRAVVMAAELEEIMNAIEARDPETTRTACVRHIRMAATVALEILTDVGTAESPGRRGSAASRNRGDAARDSGSR